MPGAYMDLMHAKDDKKKKDMEHMTLEDLRKVIKGDKASEALKAPPKKKEELKGGVRG